MVGGATIGRVRSQVVAVYAVTGAFLMGVATVTGASEAASPDRLVQSFLRVEISPNGALVASVEGQAPLNSDDPPLRELVIREVRNDHKGFLGTAAPGDGDNNWWTAKLYAFGSDGTAQVLYAPSDMQQQITAPRVSRDGRTVAFIAGLMSDFGVTGGEVYSIALAGGQPINITPAMPASATSLLWSCKNHLLAEELAGDQRQLVDLGDGRQPAATRVLWSGAETFAHNGESVSLACPSAVAATSHESFTSAPEIQVGPPGKWKDLTASNTGMRFPARVQSLQWRSNAFTVQGWLFLPEQTRGTLPLITIVHGGPASAAVPSFRGPGLDRELLGRGYALFRPNPRGSFGQGEQFTRANVRDFGHGDLSDILAGIDAAEKVAPIDDARLGITGGSYGGFMTMWTVTQTSRFKAAVAAAGVSDWLSYYGENGIDAWLLPYFGNSVYNDPAVYARSSPINFIKNVHNAPHDRVVRSLSQVRAERRALNPCWVDDPEGAWLQE